MRSTALYRAPVEAGATELTANPEKLSKAVAELKPGLRVLIAINIALVLLELRGIFA
ncbi:MAG: hypothetical protein OXI88_05715 [Gammaproteobacteria bacterium]|nr:hypothetical protein [Gammaproteobacteria bacterium]